MTFPAVTARRAGLADGDSLADTLPRSEVEFGFLLGDDADSGLLAIERIDFLQPLRDTLLYFGGLLVEPFFRLWSLQARREPAYRKEDFSESNLCL